jgi:hypothetical protein
MKSMDILNEQNLEEYIKINILPYISSHKGDIKIKSFKDKIVTITLLGNCSRCPLSQITFEEVIRQKLLEEFPNEIEDVRLYNEISDELWKYAKLCLEGDRKWM